jgi:hypothetical protein
MNFNHLIPKYEIVRPCRGEKKHYYLPTGYVEASLGHMAVRFMCKNCARMAIAFLTSEEYQIQKHLIEKYQEL